MTPQDRNNQPSSGNQSNTPYSYNQPSNGQGQPPYGQAPAPRPSQPYQPYNQYQTPTQGPAQQPQYSYQPKPGPGKAPKGPKNPFLLWGGVIGGLVVVALVTVLVIIPLFNRSTRTEADPFAAASGGGAAVATITPGATSSTVVSTTTAVTTVASTTAAAATKTTAAPNTGTGAVSGAGPGSAITTAAAIATTAPARGTTGAQILAKGEFTKIDAIHYARGTATIGVTGDGKKILRFDNFTSNQGPDLKVYLGVRSDGSKIKEGGLNLGALPATDGSYNINIPDDTDLSKYKSVVIWCEAFSVTFSVASLG